MNTPTINFLHDNNIFAIEAIPSEKSFKFISFEGHEVTLTREGVINLAIELLNCTKA